MTDPHHRQHELFQQDLTELKLTQIAEHHCAVLIGKTGLGKSH